MQFLIGIDDTDSQTTQGSGHLAKQLGLQLEEAGLADLENISRHQLLIDPAISYTGRNSSACLVVTSTSDFLQIKELCRAFLKKESAASADVGLCIVGFDKITYRVQKWGYRAKDEVLTADEAMMIAETEKLYLEGLTGEKTGVVGALAAVALRGSGNDGRILWLKGLREVTGIFTAKELCAVLNIDKVISTTGEDIADEAIVFIEEWTRPVIQNHKIALVVTEETDNETYQWRSTSKDYIKSISQ